MHNKTGFGIGATLLLAVLITACAPASGYRAELYVRTPTLARAEGWVSLREPLPDANNSWIIRAAGFQGSDSCEVPVAKATNIRIAASAKGGELEIGLQKPDGSLLVLSQVVPGSEFVYVSSQLLPPGAYALTIEAKKRVGEFNIVVQLDN